MKRLLLTLLLALTLILPVASSRADSPPVPKPLAERVNLASHVFVGRAKRVRAVDRRGRLLKPEPTHTGTASGVMVELEVEVEEVMFPAAWKPLKRVKLYFGGGIFSIKEMRQGFLAKSYVYLVREYSDKGQSWLSASYPWYLVEELAKKEEIRRVLDQRLAS